MKYSMGMFRTDIWQLGTSGKNRAVSDKYVHCLGRRIADVEGFSRARYKNALIMQPDPMDSQACYRHHCEVVDRSANRLAPARNHELDEMLWKNHLLLFLQAMDSGVIMWDDSGKVMSIKDCKVAQPELAETCKHGLFTEKLGFQAWQEDQEGVEALIAIDNMDQSFSMAEHEMELLRSYVEAACGCKPGPGMTHWDACYQAASKKASGAWSYEDHVAAYNLAKETESSRLNALSTLHFHFVNPQVMRIPVQYFEVVRMVPKQSGWLRFSLLAHAYNVHESFWVKTGNKITAKGLMPKAIENLAKSESRMKILDNFLKETLVGKIGGCKPDCEYAVLKAACNLFHKIGKVANRNTDLDAKPKAIGEAECEYRTVLRSCDYKMGPAIWAGTAEYEIKVIEKEQKIAADSQKKGTTMPTVGGPDQFKDGELVQEDASAMALAQRGLQVGAKVRVKRTMEITSGRGAIAI